MENVKGSCTLPNLVGTSCSEKQFKISRYQARLTSDNLDSLRSAIKKGNFDYFSQGTNLKERVLAVLTSSLSADVEKVKNEITNLAKEGSEKMVEVVKQRLNTAEKELLAIPEVAKDEEVAILSRRIQQIFIRSRIHLTSEIRPLLQKDLEEELTKQLQHQHVRTLASGDQKISNLQEHVKEFVLNNTLNLKNFREHSDQDIKRLFTELTQKAPFYLRKVHSLNLSGCKLIEDPVIQSIVKECPQLQTLDVSDCCNLKKLEFRDCAQLEESLFQNCYNLKKVKFSGCYQLQKLILNDCVHLQTLEFRRHYRHANSADLTTPTGNWYSRLKKANLERCSNLQTLILSGVPNDFLNDALLQCANSLRTLELRRCQYLKNINFSRCIHLKKLKTSKTTDDFLKNALSQKFPSLHTLELSHVLNLENLDPSIYSSFCPKLKALYFIDCPHIDSTSTYVTKLQTIRSDHPNYKVYLAASIPKLRY